MDLDSDGIETTTFDGARKGYEREQVDKFVREVARAMLSLEERANLDLVRAEQLEREMHELRARSDIAFAEALEAKERLIAQAERDAAEIVRAAGEERVAPSDPNDTITVSITQATVEAQEHVAAAREDAQQIHDEAARVLAEAIAQSDRIAEDRDKILNDANAEADAIQGAARSAAERTEMEALEAARVLRREAEGEHQALLARLRELRVMVSEIEHRVPALDASTQAGLEETKEMLAQSEMVTVDLRDDLRGTAGSDVDEGETLRPLVGRVSRYESRSAHLPALGDDAESVLDQMKSLRAHS